MPGDQIIMEGTKIQLSEDELLLMQNSEWILTKNRIIDKISIGFGEMVIKMQQHITDGTYNERINSISPKISRGEKYQGLPYVILDYPRHFGKEQILAVRTLFWWGNYCSITLHVKGAWKQTVLQKLTYCLEQFANGTFYISYSGDEWSHDILESNYIRLHHISNEADLKNLHEAVFIKLTAMVQLGPWSNMEKELFDLFLKLTQLIQH